MRRFLVLAVLIAVVGALMPFGSGCASSSGPAFERTRGNKAHTFRNRIHNPADPRYAGR